MASDYQTIFAINNTFAYCTNNVLYSETKLHKTLHKYLILNFMDFIISTQYFTLFLFIQD